MKQEIYFILDKNWKEDLYSLSRERHIWICQSEINSVQIKNVWEKDKGNYSQTKGVTAFELKDTIEKTFYDVLGSIDDHHHRYNFPDDGEWTKILVFGMDREIVDTTEIDDFLESKTSINVLDECFEIVKTTI